MKNYCPTIAADMAVRPNVQLGLSRHANKKLNLRKISSISTARNHKSALTGLSKWMLVNNGKHLKNATDLDIAEYLTERVMTCSQKTIDLDRQAINFHLLYADPIPFLPSQIDTLLTDRAYSDSQIELLVEMAEPSLALSILLAVNAGLRCMELVSLSTPTQLQASARDWRKDRFLGREHEVTFVVHGKGGLCREVKVAADLASHVMTQIREAPIRMRDRGVDLNSNFDLVGGIKFSLAFGRHSKKLLGFSHGAHGLRHTYAQKRRNELLCCGLLFDDAILVLAQELGHFCTKNTFAYLRDYLTRAKK